jgi:phosphatidylinositol transfer protein SFH5
VNDPLLIKVLVSRIASLHLGNFLPRLSSEFFDMSAEPAAAMAAATEPVPGTEEQKVEAAEAPSQTTSAPAPEPVPAKEETEAEAPQASPQSQPPSAVEGKRPVSPPGTPLAKLFAELPSIIASIQYTEMWGVELTNSFDVPSSIVLEKFLRANNQDVAKAKAQLIEALKWRKEIQPRKLLKETEFDHARFGDLGYVTVYPKTEGHEKEIVTWNIYGAVKNKQETFGNVEEYV